MKTKGYSVCVYITNSKIQVVTGSFTKNKISIKSYCEEPLDEGCMLNGIIMNTTSVQATLTAMWEKYKLPTSGVHLVVNGNSITVKQMRIPQTAPNAVRSLIRTEFREVENIQNLLIDYSVINPRNADGSCSILAVLSTREFIMNYVNLFKEAKIDIDVVDLMQNCIIKLMLWLKSMQNKTFTVFILDGNMLMQSLFSGNDFIMTRRSRILADPADPGFEREIGQNINSIIQFNKSEQTGADITDMFFCGFPPEALPILPRFAENFGVTTRAFPDYLPTELTIPQGMLPADFIVLLGSMIRYSS